MTVLCVFKSFQGKQKANPNKTVCFRSHTDRVVSRSTSCFLSSYWFYSINMRIQNCSIQAPVGLRAESCCSRCCNGTYLAFVFSEKLHWFLDENFLILYRLLVLSLRSTGWRPHALTQMITPQNQGRLSLTFSQGGSYGLFSRQYFTWWWGKFRTI